MRPPHSTYCTCTMRINKYWIHWTLNLTCIFALYDVVLYAFNPFKGRGMVELCINKDVLIFASAGPLIRFVFLNNVMSTLSSLCSQLWHYNRCQLLTKYDSNVVLDLLQRNDNFINMANIGGKIRFYCRTLGILWYK